MPANFPLASFVSQASQSVPRFVSLVFRRLKICLRYGAPFFTRHVIRQLIYNIFRCNDDLTNRFVAYHPPSPLFHTLILERFCVCVCFFTSKADKLVLTENMNMKGVYLTMREISDAFGSAHFHFVICNAHLNFNILKFHSES